MVRSLSSNFGWNVCMCALCIAILVPIDAQAQFDFLRNLPLPFAGRTAVDRSHLQRALELESAGDIEGATKEAESQVEADGKSGGPGAMTRGNPYLQQSSRMAARLNLKGGKPQRAVELYRLALEKSPAIANVPGGVRIVLPVKMELAAAHEAAGETAEARKIYENLLPQVRAMGDAGIIETVAVLGRWGELESRTGKSDLAEQVLRDGVQAQLSLANASNQGRKGDTTMFGALNSLRNAMDAARQMAGQLPRVTVSDASGRTIENGQKGGAGYHRDNLIRPLSALAELYFTKGDGEKLKSLYFKEFAEWRRLAGNTAGQSAGGSGTLRLRGNVQLEWEEAWFGGYFAQLGMVAESETAFDAAFKLNSERLKGLSSSFAPEEIVSLFDSRRQILGLYLEALMNGRSKPEKWESKAIGRIFDSKGMANELIFARNRAAEQMGGGAAKELMDELRVLDLEMIRGASGNLRDEIMRRVEILNRQIVSRRKLGALVAAKLPAIVLEDGSKLLDAVIHRLEGETLVGIVQYAPFDLKTKSRMKGRYAAYRVSQKGAMLVVDVGNEDEIDTLVQRYRAAIRSPRSKTADASASRAIAFQLYQRIFSPLIADPLVVPELAFDPDGMLNLLPVEALVDSSGKYLIEKAAIRNIVSPRSLANAIPLPSKKGTALVMVDPDYGLPSSESGTDVFAKLRSADGVPMGKRHFDPLPETIEEGRAIAKILVEEMGVKTTLLSGSDAKANALGASVAPRFMHLATHGFYVEESVVDYPIPSPLANGRTMSLSYPDISAGLALAGANQEFRSDSQQGIYFAKQIEQLDLSGTELAVLSACDTGNGAIAVGEGVAGLRRALEYAGARTTVTSLWSVPSVETTELMVAFYKGLAAGQSKVDALQHAKRMMMQKLPPPFFWAGFVISGDR